MNGDKQNAISLFINEAHSINKGILLKALAIGNTIYC